MAKHSGSIAVALVVGAAIGFVGGRAMSPKAEAPSAPAAAGKAAAPVAQRPAAAGDQAIFNVPFDATQPMKGSKDAKVTIIEVSDFQCPFCNRVGPTVKQIEDAYGKDVRFVWANNPLGFHPNAMPAAEAAYAAHEQGKFWEMHDKLFANQSALTRENFEKFAQELGLDMAKFKAAIDSGKFKGQIEKEQALYTSRGARGTPGFFINGRLVSGAQPFDNFKRVIDEEIKRADAELAKGTKTADLYAALIAGGATAPAAAPAAAPEAPAKPVFVEIPAGAPSKGSPDAKVTIVEFSDFECPFCSRVNPTMKQIEDTYGKDVRVVFRHLPLPFHKNAGPAAEASMAAHEQGKFWAMHDKLFANQRDLTSENFEKWAGEIGLDVKKFKAALDSGKFKAAVDADSTYAGSVGARGTPAFFVNGKLVSGAQPFDAFKRVIDEELKRADAELAKGTKPAQLYQKLAGN
ncbi:DsbA family protein [Vulgatibacter incomptus]|uniref:Periplasmic thiol:disulfide interchange protein DsbA n=1 Tax=Vulgatibacter incomptus TaxID=1391653 RepID=A0A0K1PC22_9BACT|nr:thioredoxin domain-containing protein [Vulgatibacter incomptus]AKU91075.1 Periplasmic thiol:disulfide interchange protein DsbA [Vulgatibacter incomptus]